MNKTVTLRGRRYAYLDAGSGPPLLLFHGWSGSSDNFTSWLPSLVDRFRVVIPDLPGCAGAPTLDEPHTAAAYARFGHDLAAALRLGPLAVGGLCSGASPAMAYAAAYPDEVTGMLLHTPFIHPDVIRGRMRSSSDCSPRRLAGCTASCGGARRSRACTAGSPTAGTSRRRRSSATHGTS